MILANNHNTKLRTLICSTHARTVRPTGADSPPAHFGVKHIQLIQRIKKKKKEEAMIVHGSCFGCRLVYYARGLT
jgi:hypothetical protein